MAHYFDGKHYYADSNFLNKSKGVLPGFSLEHMGFGEFYLKNGDERIDFDRMRGKDFPGKSGRSHQVTDNAKGKLVKKLIKAMEQKGKSELVKEGMEYSGAILDARKLAGISPKYHETQLARIQADGRKKPTMLKDIPIGKMQLRKGR